MKIFYYYFYYRIYHFSIKISDDALNEIKPGAFIVALELLLAFQIFVWCSVWEKKFLSIPGGNLTLFLLVLAVVGFNYFIFLHNNKWKQFDKVFAAYDKKKIFWNGIIMLLIIILILVSFIFSFYKLSELKKW